MKNLMVDNIPQELKDYPYFCVWKRDKEGRKVLLDPHTKKYAKSNDKSTFGDYACAKLACERDNLCEGLGIGIFSPLGAIDIDDCVKNGNLSEMAQNIVDIMHSYTEFSPSGHGLRIFFYAPNFVYDKDKYYIMNRDRKLEVYIGGCTHKYVTVTGNVLTASFIEDKSAEIALVLEKYMKRLEKPKAPPKAKPPAASARLTDAEVIAKASRAKNGEQFVKLWKGDYGEFSSQSEADLKLCSLLAFWTGGNLGQMDRLFRGSALIRNKWDEQRGAATYGQTTLEKAVQGCKSFYGQKPKKKKQNSNIISPFSDYERYTADDRGNGYTFADSFINELRFCPESKSWFSFDGTLWRAGGDETARERAKEVADFLWRFASNIKSEEKRKPYLKNAQALRSQSKRETMLKDAQSVHPLRMSQLDTNHDYFNCKNYTLDLARFKAIRHNPEHMLSKVAGADFVPDAKCERWEKFIDEIMCGDKR